MIGSLGSELPGVNGYVWVDPESTRQVARKKEYMEKMGYRTFYKFGIGETEVEVVDMEPRVTKDGRSILRVKIAGEEWDISPSPVLYGKILDALKRGSHSFIIMRVGSTQKDTRYDLIPID